MWCDRERTESAGGGCEECRQCRNCKFADCPPDQAPCRDCEAADLYVPEDAESTTLVVEPGYGPLFKVLIEAFSQAAAGKGKERHANGLPFLEQPIMVEARMIGLGFPAGQARKKILEAVKTSEKGEHDRAVADLLGAINYCAATILAIRETAAA